LVTANAMLYWGTPDVREEQVMCDTHDDAPVLPVDAVPEGTEWRGEVLPLEPVDEVSVLTVCDNTVDLLLADQGPVTRLPLSALQDGPKLAAPTLVGGKAADAPLGQHGFSALVEVRKGGQVHRLLFDTGVTPTGCVDNLRRLGRDPAADRPARPGEPAGAAASRVLDPAPAGHPGPRAARDPDHQPPGAGGGQVQHHRAASAVVPVRPVGADHR
jgi:hypothetical protein